MTREEIINMLAQRIVNSEKITTMQDAVNYVLNWAEEHQVNPWRDAKNDPPKDEGRVFVSYAGLKSSAYYYGDGEWNVEGYGLCDFVNYWMPIPETPEGGEE